MFRFALLAVIPCLYAQNFPAFRWIQQIDNSGTDTFAGIGTDAQGNTYVAESTLSPNLPVKNAAQQYLATAGLFRIDGPGSAYTHLGLNIVVVGLTPDPANPNVFYAISQGLGRSGVKSVDGGNTWAPLNMPSTLVEQFAVDPANDQNVYAIAFDVGFLKSTDGGATWNLIDNGITPCSNCGLPPGSLGGFNIWIDPNSTNVLFGSFDSYGLSLVRSADSGASWQTVGPSGNFYGLYFETPKPGVLYLFTINNGAFKSIDDGQTFQAVNIPVTSVYADPAHAGRLLGNGTGGIFESDDDGVTWTLTLPRYTISAADWANGVLYGSPISLIAQPGFVQISSDLKTVTVVGPAGIDGSTAVVSNGHAYVPNSGGYNVFVTKFDPSGNVVYATYFGGSGDDGATALAVDAAGNVYVTGTNSSHDFPATKGSYAPAWSSGANAFLFKLNPDGSVAYATYFPGVSSNPNAVAVDGTGSVYITGDTNGGLPTTPGAYQTVCGCITISTGLAKPASPKFEIMELDAFVTKFDPAGASLVYSTYMGVSNANGKEIVLGSDGSAYIASGYPFATTIYHLNATGSALLATGKPPMEIGAMAIASDGRVYLAGSPNGPASQPGSPVFQPTAGAFQTTLPTSLLSTQSNSIAAVMRMDAGLQNVLAATYFGGPYGPNINAMTIDPAGNIYIAGGTPPRGLPTRTPIVEPFGPINGTGFLSELMGDLSTLLFSTYLGDAQYFAVLGIGLGGAGNVVIAGETANPLVYETGNIWVNSVSVTAPPALRIDAVDNAASMLDGPISAGETVVIRGAGFGSDSQLTIGGAVVPTLAITPTQITAVLPAITAAAVLIEVQSGGATSNPLVAAVAAASPGIFSANGTGSGQGYILNKDGTLNTPSNPAAPGDPITIYATGVGPMTFTNGYAVTASPANVFIDGFFCDGVAAVLGPVPGLPGNVFQLTVYVPNPALLVQYNPNLKDFTFPPLVGVILQVAGQSSQNGLSISISQ